MASVSINFPRAALVACLILPSAAQAQPPVQQVLLLHGADRGNLVLDSFTGNFRADLDDRAGRPVNVVQIVVGPTGLAGASDQAALDYIRATFAARPKPDLILTSSGPAAVFARTHRQQLFPDTPLLFASIDQRFLRDAPLGDNEVAVAVINDFPGLVDDILRLLPRTKQVFVVTGSGPIGRFWRPELERQFQRFGQRLTFLWSDTLSFPEMVRRCSSLPRDSAIVYIAFGADAQGGAYADERVLAELHDSANAPMFAAHSPLLGHGIVGGRLMSIRNLSRSTADTATRILNGAPPSSVSVPPLSAVQATYDWRELQRWQIAESRLPAGSVVLYRAPSLWQEHKGAVLGWIGALLIQSLLIVGLLYERRARRRAESDSRRNLAIAADANRRQTMSALTTSIAHELGQPLSSMIHNAEALQAMVDADRATTDVTKEILADIRTQGVQAAQIIERHRAMLRGHQLHRTPIDLHDVVYESLALVGHDLKTREIEATVNLSSSPCVVDGDPVFLQQVLVNLTMNAIDAMAETPPGRRRLAIATTVGTAGVELSVRDSGTGLPPEFDGTVFTPFVTTKPHGLGIGLTIVRTIVDAHGGAFEARNNPDGGAMFTVTLPRAGSRHNRSASEGAA
jgi:signal transduction histidine kinase